uniref:Bis(5'-nucleosyl)-tetraphosphatase [asymmetrical] n=1 Tax=Hirondellea gigas TaxID=1518452 RepID=A0A2P2I427_9CRUS
MSIEVVRASGIVIYRRVAQQLEYLLMQTAYGNHHWTPPKGHVDPGEDDWQTALRETQEEAGLVNGEHYVLDDDFKREVKYIVKDKPKVVVYYLAELKQELSSDKEDPVKMSDEHQAYKWLPIDQAIELVVFQTTSNLLQECHDYLSSN